MEGALASVVGGLVRCPVVAVPTSLGYGVSLRGLAALLAMLNSCAAGVSVVNIDNGFGAGLTAARYARGLGEAVKADRAGRAREGAAALARDGVEASAREGADAPAPASHEEG
jgi:hypothetical protein